MCASESRQLLIRFLIRQLNWGGAQRQIVELGSYLRDRAQAVEVLTFYESGYFWDELKARGFKELYTSAKSSRYDVLAWQRLWKMLAAPECYVLLTYFSTGNIIGALRKRFGAVRPILIWNVRRSSSEQRGLLHKLLDRVENILSDLPDLIFANSEAGRRYLLERGWSDKKIRLFPNGVDTTRFSPNHESRNKFRVAHRISNDACVITLPARLHPVKDHALFFEAARVFIQNHSPAPGTLFFLCVGTGSERYRSHLKRLIDQKGLRSWISILEASEDIEEVYNGSDLVTLTSQNEGFPNVIVEAMAVGLPVVTVDVGDCRKIVGDCGRIVERTPECIATGWSDLLGRWTEEDSVNARRRVFDNYSFERQAALLVDYLSEVSTDDE